MKKLILLFMISIVFPSVSSANICEKIPGKWIGQWHDENNTIYDAILKIQSTNPQTNFYGKYFLSTKSTGLLHGQCQPVSVKEAYLKLDKRTKINNPCRGLII